MSRINSRAELKNYCLRQLGAPVVSINVADEQLEDRIDDALDLFWEYHTDGTELVFLHRQMTQDDIDRGYLLLPPDIRAVISVIAPGKGSEGGGNGIASINLQYQSFITDMMNYRKIMQGGLGTFHITWSYLGLINDTFSAEGRMAFNHLHDKLTLQGGWNLIKEGDWITIECYRAIDPEAVGEVYNDRWLKAYCTALFKKQWGFNLTKLSNVPLPGGVTLNGDKIHDEGKEEVQRLEEELQTHYQGPPMFFMG